MTSSKEPLAKRLGRIGAGLGALFNLATAPVKQPDPLPTQLAKYEQQVRAPQRRREGHDLGYSLRPAEYGVHSAPDGPGGPERDAPAPTAQRRDRHDRALAERDRPHTPTSERGRDR